MLESLTADSFEPHRGESFRVVLDGAWADLELIAVETRDSATAPGGRRRPFSLLFRGPTTPFLEQRIYALEHRALGRLELFMVPVGKAGSGFEYEAVFS